MIISTKIAAPIMCLCLLLTAGGCCTALARKNQDGDLANIIRSDIPYLHCEYMKFRFSSQHPRMTRALVSLILDGKIDVVATHAKIVDCSLSPPFDIQPYEDFLYDLQVSHMFGWSLSQERWREMLDYYLLSASDWSKDYHWYFVSQWIGLLFSVRSADNGNYLFDIIIDRLSSENLTIGFVFALVRPASSDLPYGKKRQILPLLREALISRIKGSMQVNAILEKFERRVEQHW